MVEVPAMAHWVKIPTAVVWVSVEEWVQSPALHRGLRDLVLMLRLRFSTWPGNFLMLWLQPFKTNKQAKGMKWYLLGPPG